MKRNAPDYYCTWLEQGRRWAKNNFPFDDPLQAWAEGAPDMVNSRDFFGTDGLAEAVPEDLRRDLIFLIDSGWDVPYGTVNADDMKFGTLVADDERFPETAGKSAAEKLSWLSCEFRKRGWKGIGIWVAAHEAEGLLEGSEQLSFWQQKILESREAGVLYWKVDWGRRMYDADFRRMLTDLGRKLYPDLWIEHALVPPGHLNDGKGEGVFRDEKCLTSAAGQLRFADVFRTYDCTWSVNNSVTAGRAAVMMQLAAAAECTGECILNLESAPVLAVAFGGTFGVMTPPDSSVLPEELAVADDAMDNARLGFDGLRMAVNFRRLAAPFAVGLQETVNNISENWLQDEYELPAIYGSDSGAVKIMVPAAVTRGISLPQISDAGEGVPMTVATRYMKGVFAVAALPRAIAGKVKCPRAEVSMDLPEPPVKAGIFGSFSNLMLKWQGCGKEEFIIRSLLDPAGIAGRLVACDGVLTIEEQWSNVIIERSTALKGGIEE